MSQNNRDRDRDPRLESAFAAMRSLNTPEQSNAETLARIEGKIDTLIAALVKPSSSIILVGDDIARIAAELKKGQP